MCQPSSPAYLRSAEVPRSQSGWIQKGKELDPASVNFCRTFKAPQLKFLLMWRGDSDVDKCCVMSCPQYDVMSGASAFRMCAQQGVGVQ